MSGEITTVRLRIFGRVQGVGFRAFAVDEAEALGLTGWVRNRRDDTVEVLVSGPDEAVKAFAVRCARGSAAARVSHMDIERAEPDGGTSFTWKPTV
ncbi:MAG: acylphosphatase [Alphaproteobacteria bacterium]